MKQTRTSRWAALALAFAMMWTAACGAAYAQEATPQTMTFADFLQALKDGNGTFDGKGVTVEWKPDETVVKIDRVQNTIAQYQLFTQPTLADIHISNVNFKYDPQDILDHKDAWNGPNPGNWTKETIRHAELQFLNSGNVTIENCNFDQVIVGPYGANTGDYAGDNKRINDAKRTFTVVNSSFANIEGKGGYALKDIYPGSAFIQNNTFRNCDGAIYFEGGTERKSIVVENNTFDGVGGRAVIQFSAACVLNGGTPVRLSNNVIKTNLVNDGGNKGSLAVLRQICNMEGVMLNGWTPGEAFSTKIESGKTLTLPDMPSNSQYAFRGWAKAGDYKGPTTGVTSADGLKPSGAQATGGLLGTFYYAVWEKQIVSFTVTYTDGVDGETIFADQTITAAAGSSTPAFNGTPAREGYVFKGWTPAVSEKVTGNVIYTARWEKAPAAPPKTGDSSSPWLWLTLMLAAGGGLAGMSMRRKAGR